MAKIGYEHVWITSIAKGYASIIAKIDGKNNCTEFVNDIIINEAIRRGIVTREQLKLMVTTKTTESAQA